MNTTLALGPLTVTFDAAAPSTLYVFALLNILIHSIVPLPVSSVFWVAAVVLYGPLRGFLLALSTSAIGCYLALPLTRSCLRPLVIRMLGPNAQTVWYSLDRAIVRERWKIPLLVRATPVMPVVPINFFLALTSIDEWTYAWTVTVGMIPAGIPFAYAAVVGQQVLDDFPPHDPLLLGTSLVGLVATALAAYKIGVIATNELSKHGVESPDKRPTTHFRGEPSTGGSTSLSLTNEQQRESRESSLGRDTSPLL